MPYSTTYSTTYHSKSNANGINGILCAIMYHVQCRNVRRSNREHQDECDTAAQQLLYTMYQRVLSSHRTHLPLLLLLLLLLLAYLYRPPPSFCLQPNTHITLIAYHSGYSDRPLPAIQHKTQGGRVFSILISPSAQISLCLSLPEFPPFASYNYYFSTGGSPPPVTPAGQIITPGPPLRSSLWSAPLR